MHLDISALPTPIQEQIAQIKAGEQLILTHTGKPLLSAIVQPSYANGDFNYDLERMKQMMDCELVAMPKGVAKDLESFEKWLAGAFQ